MARKTKTVLRLQRDMFLTQSRVSVNATDLTPCALYGCGSWTLRNQDEHEIVAAQRRMLRAILGKSRRRIEQEAESTLSSNAGSDGDAGEDSEDEAPIESWTDWLQRTTAEVRAAMSKLNLDEWAVTARRRQWTWACSVARHSPQRWTSRILHYQPAEGLRHVGRPRLRWIDPIDKFAQDWTGMPETSNAWVYLLGSTSEADRALTDFMQFCIQRL